MQLGLYRSCVEKEIILMNDQCCIAISTSNTYKSMTVFMRPLDFCTVKKSPFIIPIRIFYSGFIINVTGISCFNQICLPDAQAKNKDYNTQNHQNFHLSWMV